MKSETAAGQIRSFLHRIGITARTDFPDRAVQIRIGDAVIGFEFDTTVGEIKAQALIYRFRRPPTDAIIAAITETATDFNTGGGEIVLESESKALVLERRFPEGTDDASFYHSVNQLARASMSWTTKLLGTAAAKANA